MLDVLTFDWYKLPMEKDTLMNIGISKVQCLVKSLILVKLPSPFPMFFVAISKPIELENSAWSQIEDFLI